MDKNQAKTGNLTITLATFIYMLHDSGKDITDINVKEICKKVEELIRRASLRGCVEQVQQVLDSHRLDCSDEAIKSFLNDTYGKDIFENIDINDIGTELVNSIEESLSPKSNIEQVYSWLSDRYDNVHNSWGADDRESLICEIRKHSFKSSLPWLAQIAERNQGELVTHWVLVEKFTDCVICMDPYPWDDVDEEYQLPLVDFMVKWELAGSNSIHIGIN
jgi:hypothetical protein